MSKSTFSWTKIENKLNQNKKKSYPFIANSYVVSFGSVVTSFSKISGISLKTTEYTPFNEGGRDMPYILLDQSKNFNTITFERGLGIGFQGSTLTDMLQFVEKIRIRDMLLIIYGNTPQEKKAYYTDTAYVKDIVLSDLNATSQEVLIQSMTIVYDVFKESKDESNRGQNNNPSTVSNVGTFSAKKNNTSSNNTGKTSNVLQTANNNGKKESGNLTTVKQNEDIKKASQQNSTVSQNEQNKLEAQKKTAEEANQQKEQACFIDNILNTVETAVDNVDKAVSQVEKQVDKAVGEVVSRIEKFGEIIEKAEKVVDKVDKLDEIPEKAVKKIEKAVDEVVEKKENLEKTVEKIIE